MNKNCVLCLKHASPKTQPLGVYFYSDAHLRVYHAPADKGPLRTLLFESQRHFLDFTNMTREEAASYGTLLKRMIASIKQFTRAERIYSIVFLEGVPHFHNWLVPRRKGDKEKCIPFLEKDITCNEKNAVALAEKLRKKLSK
ncbi:MAG TPA: hypothetical protein G4N92_06170 [Anaerolineae bacterium]|nr:hypothetical protein [Anaerolineae bacterium]